MRGHSVVVAGKELIVFGGETRPSTPGPTSNLEVTNAVLLLNAGAHGAIFLELGRLTLVRSCRGSTFLSDRRR